MKKLYKKLFSFSQNQIDAAFAAAHPRAQMRGIKLITAPLSTLPPDLFSPEHGMLLIVSSRKTGKAHIRNRLRRQIKSIFYEQKLYEKKLVGIVFVYKEAVELTFEDMKSFLVGAYFDTLTKVRGSA